MKNFITSTTLFVFLGICFAIQAQIPCGSPIGGNCTNPADDYSHIVWRDLDYLYASSDASQNIFYFTDDIPPIPFLGCPNGVPQTAINDFGANNFAVGDEIGIFYEINDTLFCVGYSLYSNDPSSTESIVVYGDDISTSFQESYGDGEPFEIMLIRKNGFANYYINFEIDGVNNFPCGNVFADPNGDFTNRADSRLEAMTVLDCNGIANGPNRLDNCGVCDDDPSNDNTTCFSCNDPAACNYVADAINIDNSVCDYANNECTNPCNYVLGCTSIDASNYNPLADCDDGSCISCIQSGCADPTACNYSASSECYDDCIYEIDCNTDPCISGGIYEWDASVCNCLLVQAFNEGCIDPTASNYDSNADCDDGSCTYPSSGCIDPTACNYNPDATAGDGSCIYETACDTDPCINGGVYEWDTSVCDCVLVQASIEGCIDPTAPNYDPNANCDDGFCTYSSSGCIDPSACNYNPNTIFGDISTCDYGNTDCPDPCNVVYGCTDLSAINYNNNANCDDGSCFGTTTGPHDCNNCLPNFGCLDPDACNYDPNVEIDDGSCDFGYPSCSNPCAPISGCTNADACNYNSIACADDGSCIENFLNPGLGRDGALYGITNFPISGNEVYTWYNGNDQQVAQFTNNPYFAPSEVGTYYMVVSDPDYPGCTQLLGPATITDLNGCCELESDGN